VTTHKSITLDFLSNEADEDEGLGDAGIETFRDRPYASTAREIAQNSRDAADNLPVRINFDLLELPFAQVPALDALRKANAFCLQKARDTGDAKEIAHFEQAQRVLETEPLKVLRISDYNTLGLKGPAKSGTPFHSLIKGSGVSVKQSEASGGSFGIGKNAVFAISDLQTVLYSTIWQDAETGQKKFLAQGKAVLRSHTDDAGKNHRAASYWGIHPFLPIENPADAPEWLRREEVGTSLFVLGFRETENWQHRIAYALLENFFYAVNEGEIEFSIGGGSIVISRASLASLFEDPHVIAAADADDHDDEFALARQHYQCVISPDAREDTVKIKGLGDVRIRVHVADDLPKKVCIIRNGMVITDSLENFGDRFSRFAMHRDFVAVVVPVTKEGSAFIKRLENPRHDGLSAERLPDVAAVNEARRVMKALAKAIRETIRSHTFIQFDNEMSVDEMRDYFSADADQSDKSKKSGQDDPATVRYTVEPRRPRTETRAAAPGKGNAGGTTRGPTPGPNPGPGPGDKPRPHNSGTGKSGNARAIRLQEVRHIPLPAKGAYGRTILFTPDETGTAIITLEASGLSDSEELRVVGATGADVVNGHLRHQAQAGERSRIEVEFSEPYAGPLELRVGIEKNVEAVHEA